MMTWHRLWRIPTLRPFDGTSLPWHCRMPLRKPGQELTSTCAWCSRSRLRQYRLHQGMSFHCGTILCSKASSSRDTTAKTPLLPTCACHQLELGGQIMSNQFLEANFNGGLQAPHYFNGRLLSAEDLQADQSATLTHESWLGRASGYGVIEGLMVTQVRGTASVQITAGTGLNRVGQFIRLPNDIVLSLLQQPAADQKAVNGPVNDAGRFTTCDAPGPKIGENGTSSAGAYLLTALPASRFEGQAPITPTVGNGSSSNSAGCGSKWEVEGLQFKTIRLAAFTEWSNGIFQGGVSLNAMRNLLAHWCYGSPAQPELALDPFHFPASFGGIDLLAPADLAPGDLPLAVFYWPGETLAFVDAWPVRRRLVGPDAVVERR